MYKLNYFNFMEREKNYLITNDAGRYAFLSNEDFRKLVNKEKLEENTYKELMKKGFIYSINDEIFANEFANEVHKMKEYIFSPTSLHIFVVSKNCNFRCVYCQAGNLGENQNYKMSEETAKRAVDIAMQSPSNYLTFEFQGGEPLTNFEIIKFIIEYSKSINQNKNIEYNLVSNLTLLTDDMIEYFMKNEVMICTSIDGNKEIQNKNRPYPFKDSYDETVSKIKRLQNLNVKVNAIETTSRYNLTKYKELVDEYISLKLNNISLRPLTQLGKADINWKNIGYEVKEFLEFYKKTFDYIIQKNKEGYFIAEDIAKIFLKKIINNESVNYMELRSPCGGVLGQLAYYYDGNIFTCDEGRMLYEMGEETFKIGNVYENNFKELIESDITEALAVSSCIECIPTCNSCVYSPYCGTCPIITLSQDDNIFAKNPNEFRCSIYKGILNILFEYIEKDDDIKRIFEKWIN